MPRLMDGLAALTLVLAGVRSAAHGGVAAWAVAAVQWAVALAFLAREGERRAAPARAGLAATPSLLLAGATFAAGRDAPWPAAATGLVVVGGAFTLAGVASLGRSFAVLPGVRRLRTGGLYTWVRHPVYLGELTMLAGAAARLGAIGLVAWAAGIAATVWRIVEEERLWAAEPGWAAWAAAVRWRLVPGVW